MATDRTIFTGLNKESFEKGLRWIRATKQTGLTLLVVNMGLDESHIEKLNELGVKLAPNINKTGVPQVDLFNSFLSYVKEAIVPGTYLYWDMEVETESVGALWGCSRFVAPTLAELNVATLVFPLTTIDARVKIGEQLEKSDVVYFSGLMAGKILEWKLFVGLYNSLIETGVVESLISSRNLVLNLFALYFKDHIEPKPVEYKISALQLEN